MTARFIAVLKDAGLDLTAEEIADALWLANQAGPLSFFRTDEERTNTDPNPVDGSPPAEHEDAQMGSPSAERVGTPEELRKGSEAYLPQSDNAGLAAATPGIGVVSFRSPAAPALPGALGVARSLRPLMRRVPSRTEFALDAETTVQRIAEEGTWLPVMRPAASRWLEVALVVDEGASMVIWQEMISELRRLLERHGAFRDVRTWGLITDGKKGHLQLQRADGAHRE